MHVGVYTYACVCVSPVAPAPIVMPLSSPPPPPTGMIVALLASPIVSWPALFYSFGALGYVWVALYFVFVPTDLTERCEDRVHSRNP